MGRQKKGQDTWKRLRDWHDGQTSSERLASRLLLLLGYTSIDPSHPMGGPDGKKDIVCKKDGKKWIVGVYFPNGQKDFKEIEKKFEQDLEGVDKNEGDGFIFISNQELKLSEKDLLKNKQDFDIKKRCSSRQRYRKMYMILTLSTPRNWSRVLPDSVQLLKPAPEILML
jgi:hypothetical protein